MPRRKNRGVHVKFRKERSNWEVVEYIRGGIKRHSVGHGCREDAEEKLAEIIIQRSAPERNEDILTLGELIAYYIKEHLPSLARPDTALKCFERLIPFWGDLLLSDIKKSKVYEYVDYRRAEFYAWQKGHDRETRKELKMPTVRRELEQLQACIGYAYRDNIISICPFLWKPDKSRSRDRWLTKKEAGQLIRASKSLQHASEYLPLFILIGLYTGARTEAILKLRWPQVDFKRGLIDFTLNQTNNIKKAAVVPMTRRIRRELLKAKLRGSDLGYVIHQNQRPIKSVKNSFRTSCDIAELENVTPHILRHTAASWMVQKNVSASKVAKYIGCTTQVIENTYGHLAPDHLKEAVESYG